MRSVFRQITQRGDWSKTKREPLEGHTADEVTAADCAA
jgi:hypothetical protein